MADQSKPGSYEAAILLLAFASQAIVSALKIRDNSAVDSEWSAEEEATFDAKVADAKAGKLVEWQIDPDPS